MLVVLLVMVSDDSLQSQCSCGFSYNDIITTTYTLTLACVLVCACVYVIGSLPVLAWLTVAPSWQGLAGRLARWDGVLDTVDIFGGGGVG